VTKLGGYPVVAKTVNSRQGKGVMIVKSALTAKFIMDNLIDRTQGLLVQQFIPTDHRRDIRVLVLGERVVAAMELRPSAGDFRTNIHLNGKGRLVKLKKEIEELAVAAPRALGLEISGTDIIVDGNGTAMVIEANASPGFKGLEAVAGIDIASRIIRYVAETRGGRS
jgi:ribosomal protein S6--L-glutamate ligase